MPPTRRVAVVIDLDWTLKHHHEVFAGTQRYAQEQGWDSVVWPHPPVDLVPRRGGKGYDGVIARVTPQLAARARGTRLPLVNVWLSCPVRDVPTVAPDLRLAGQIAAEHLVARGFSRFGYLGFQRVRASQHLEAGFRATTAAAGRGAYARLLVPSSFSRTAQSWGRFQGRLAEWAKQWRPPLGILATNDKPARYTGNAARQLGLRVPADVALIGVGNETVVCLNPEPTLSSIEIGFKRVGYRAAALLDELMDGAEPPEDPILLPPMELVVRRSTDAFAVEDSIVARALRFIADECHRPIKVAEVVDQVATSWRSLERRFRKTRRGTIAEEITRLRLERVKRLLVETELPVKKVASACGFGNAKQLCATFRRVEGTSPGDYRRQRTDRSPTAGRPGGKAKLGVSER